VSYWVDRLAATIPDNRISIAGRRGPFKRLIRRIKYRVTQSGLLAGCTRKERPDCLLMEIINPSEDSTNLSLSVHQPRISNRPGVAIPYQDLLECKPGFNRFKIPYSAIAARVGDQDRLRIALTPNILSAEEEGLTLYFGTLAFVLDGSSRDEISGLPGEGATAGSPPPSPPPHVKLVVWDLDNTLWDGILVEDGADRLRLRRGVPNVLEEMDRRGILHSVVSKNDPGPALHQLDAFGIKKYFLFPQISWGTKANAIHALIKDFNIGPNTIAFVDDSAFEREHVRRVHPTVRVYDASEYLSLLDKPEFKPSSSTEASRRRYYYTTQQQRDSARGEFDGDYLEFLHECKIKLDVWPGSRERLDRMFELITRTNQLNFSGNLYSRKQIEGIIASDQYASYCVDCRDRFGEYGMIGFALIDQSRNRLVDMAFSCRVQSKRVEHAFLGFLLGRHGGPGVLPFEAVYRQTERNRGAGLVFVDLGFVVSELNEENAFIYKYDSDSLPTQDTVEVAWHGDSYGRQERSQG
jgi:FkbH-like protein